MYIFYMKQLALNLIRGDVRISFFGIYYYYKIGYVCEADEMSKPYKAVVADDYRISRTFLR